MFHVGSRHSPPLCIASRAYVAPVKSILNGAVTLWRREETIRVSFHRGERSPFVPLVVEIVVGVKITARRCRWRIDSRRAIGTSRCFFSVAATRLRLYQGFGRERLFCNRLLNALLIGERISLCYVYSVILVDIEWLYLYIIGDLKGEWLKNYFSSHAPNYTFVSVLIKIILIRDMDGCVKVVVALKINRKSVLIGFGRVVKGAGGCIAASCHPREGFSRLWRD